MKAVVDTNVVAYYLLGTPDFAPQTQAFWRDAAELLAPASWEAELANVVWMAVRTRSLTAEEGSAKLHLAARLGIRSIAIRTLWHGALAHALHSRLAVYDTLFVELAEREDALLITFDAKLLAAYPAIAKRPS